jgi:hypothetical protein
MYAVLKGDIVNSSKIDNSSLFNLMKKIESLVSGIKAKKNYDVVCDLTDGDSFYVLLNNPEYAIEVAVLLRATVLSNNSDVRICIGFGNDVPVVDERLSISQGSGFVHAGRGLNRILKKQRLVVSTDNENVQEDLNVCCMLLSLVISEWSAHTAELLFRVVFGQTNDEILEIYKKKKYKSGNAEKEYKSISFLENIKSIGNYKEVRKAIDWSSNYIKRYMEQR